MTPAIPTSADQGALPPGLAEASASHLEPGEALRWAGRGTRAATFLALAPGMALMSLFLGLFAWALLAIEGWEFHGGGSADQAGALSPDTFARGFGIAVAGLLLYYLFLFVRRVLGAGRDILFLTDRRLVAAAGRRSSSTPLLDIKYARATCPHYGALLSFVTRGVRGKPGAEPALFGLVNVDAALAELQALDIATEDLRETAKDEAERPPPLAVGESVRWSGRRGWRAVGSSRLILLGWAAPALLLFAFGAWWIWRKWSRLSLTGDPVRDIAVPAVEALVVALLFGPMMFGILWVSGPFFRELLVDIFGRLAVTDRRILFLNPVTGTVAREVTGERLRGADLVELDDSGRGQIVLTLAQEDEEEPEWVDLFAVPDAAGAVEVMARLVRR